MEFAEKIEKFCEEHITPAMKRMAKGVGRMADTRRSIEVEYAYDITNDIPVYRLRCNGKVMTIHKGKDMEKVGVSLFVFLEKITEVENIKV